MSNQPVDAEREREVAAALLARLRMEQGQADLSYAEPPARLHGGNHTFVYAFRLAGAGAPWDGPLVLRILRAHRNPDEVVFESALQNALAPLAPRVLMHSTRADPLGGAFQVMERIPGSALLLDDVGQDVQHIQVVSTLLRGLRVVLFGDWPVRLAETHARVHALPTARVCEALAAVGMEERLSLAGQLEQLAARVEKLGARGLHPALRWLRERAPGLRGPDSLCHGDLFPNQVYRAGDGELRVIDWADALLAPGSLDVGYVCAGIETIPLPIPGAPALQRLVTRRFREAYAALRPIDPEAFEFGEVLRALHALVAHASHRAGCGPVPVPYDSPKGVRLLEARLARHGAASRLDG